jgi:hypothetical protein
MGFVPISIQDYVRIHLKSNPRDKEAQLTAQLQWALKELKAGAVCNCGEPIWVLGSAQVGLMCFTCITGSTDNSKDYEIDEACRSASRRGPRSRLKSRAPRLATPPPDPAVWERSPGEITEDDVAF